MAIRSVSARKTQSCCPLLSRTRMAIFCPMSHSAGDTFRCCPKRLSNSVYSRQNGNSFASHANHPKTSFQRRRTGSIAGKRTILDTALAGEGHGWLGDARTPRSPFRSRGWSRNVFCRCARDGLCRRTPRLRTSLKRLCRWLEIRLETRRFLPCADFRLHRHIFAGKISSHCFQSTLHPAPSPDSKSKTGIETIGAKPSWIFARWPRWFARFLFT